MGGDGGGSGGGGGMTVIRLPPGFRFQPTDEELVTHYLRRKVLSCPLPASIIPDIQLSRFDPWDLPGMCVSFYYLCLFLCVMCVCVFFRRWCCGQLRERQVLVQSENGQV